MTEQTGGSNRDMFGASGFGDTSGFGGLAVREQQLVSSPKPYGGWFDEATTALEHAFPRHCLAACTAWLNSGQQIVEESPAFVR